MFFKIYCVVLCACTESKLQTLINVSFYSFHLNFISVVLCVHMSSYITCTLFSCFFFLVNSRVNKTKILEFLSTKWAEDRRAEWSIWMVCSKVEMPHHYISRRNTDFSHPTVPKRVASLWKLPDDVNSLLSDFIIITSMIYSDKYFTP